jgi:PAS domain S-box-containing protein
MASTWMRTSVRRRATSHMMLLAFAMILGLTLVSFLFMRGVLVKRVLSQAEAIATTNQGVIEDGVRAAKYQAALLSAAPQIRQALLGQLDRDGLNAYFQKLREDRSDLLGIGVFNASHRRIIAIGEQVTLPIEQHVRSTFHPLLGEDGWDVYDVVTPIRSGETVDGFLVIRMDATPLLAALLPSLPSLGQTARVHLGLEQSRRLMLIHPAVDTRDRYLLSMGDAAEWYSLRLPLSLAVRGQQGYMQGSDHTSKPVLASYRPLPSLGWGLSVQIDRDDALSSVTTLGYSLLGVGGIMLVLAAFLAAILARELTHPLRVLSQKIMTMKPGAWTTSVTVKTGDEVELLDRRLSEMASRLQGLYEHLEQEVGNRTKELKKQHAYDRAILEGIQHGVITVDLMGRVTGANPAALSLLGWNHDEVIGKRIEDTAAIHAAGKTDALSPHPVRKCLKIRKGIRPKPGSLYSIRRTDGTLLPTLFLVSPLLQGRRLFGAVLVFQDVRDERRMDELKSEFIALASHQLRTPLSIIRWHMDLLVDEGHLAARQKDSVEEMHLATNRMSDLLNALLQVAQLEGGGLTPKPTRVDLQQFLRGVSSEAHLIAQRSGIHFIFHAPKQRISNVTDTVLLGIALQNLLTNAVKYSPKKTNVELSVKRTRRAVEIIVADHGMGIPAKEQRHLFEKFFRASNARKIQTDGSGLGLYIAKMIVDSLGGTIHVKSTEGKGTTFTIALPLHLKEE